VNRGDPTGWRPQRIYCPMALSDLTTILAVTASFVRESAFSGFHVMFRPTWTDLDLLCLLHAPQHQNPDFASKVASDLHTTCSRSLMRQ
jgi:hypothetical protein